MSVETEPGFAGWNNKALGEYLVKNPATGRIEKRYTTPILPTKPKGGPMDLGTLLTDLGTAYINARYQTPTTPAFSLPIPGTGLGIEADIPFVDLVRPKKKCRRRRKRLATATDIRDLSSLRATLGSGEAFKQWIATHPSY